MSETSFIDYNKYLGITSSGSLLKLFRTKVLENNKTKVVQKK